MLLSLSISLSSSSVLDHESVLHFFLLSNRIVFLWTYRILFILHQFMDIWVVSTFRLFWIILLKTFTPRPFCQHTLSILLSRYREVESLSHIVTLGSTFWGPAKLLFKVVALVLHPQPQGKGLQCAHILANTFSRLLCYRRPNGGEVESQCGFCWHLPNGTDVESPRVLFSHLYNLLWEDFYLLKRLFFYSWFLIVKFIIYVSIIKRTIKHLDNLKNIEKNKEEENIHIATL